MVVMLTPLQHLLVVVSGVFVGFVLGLIGGGGSILAVPLLLYLVGYYDVHTVLGTTALSVALTAYLNIISHWRVGTVRWKPALAFAISGAVGAAIGSRLGTLFPGKSLLFLFALLMIGVALMMLRSQKLSSSQLEHSGWTLLARLFPISFLVGLLAGFFGIGGGFLIVPGLMFATGMPLVNAVGSSLLSVGLFGTTTAITYALAGYINWIIAAEYLLGGILGGIVGTRFSVSLAKRKNILTRLFAAVLFLVAAYMLYVNAAAIHW
jgi:uncharacterized membrane protein YfcA